MRKSILLMVMFCYSFFTYAQEIVELPIDSKKVVKYTHPEKQYFSPDWGVQVVTNVSKPTLTVYEPCLLYTSPSPRDATLSRMPSSA